MCKYENFCNENIKKMCRNCCQNNFEHNIKNDYLENEDLFQKSNKLQQEAKMLNKEAKVLRQEGNLIKQQAMEYERQSKELFAKANIILNNANKLECESNSIMELSSFYNKKYYETYKNLNGKYKEEKRVVGVGCTPRNFR